MLVSNVLDYAVTATPTDGDPILSVRLHQRGGVRHPGLQCQQRGVHVHPHRQPDRIECLLFFGDGQGRPQRVGQHVRGREHVGGSGGGFVWPDPDCRGGRRGPPSAIPVKLAYSGNAAVQVRFSGPTNGTARWGTDFTCATNLTIAGASSGDIVVTIVNDYLAEGPESVMVTLVPVPPATAGSITQAVLFVRDDDTVSIVAANTSTGSQEYEGPGQPHLPGVVPRRGADPGIQHDQRHHEAVYRAWVDQNFGTNFNFYHVRSATRASPTASVSRWPISQSGDGMMPRWATAISCGRRSICLARCPSTPSACTSRPVPAMNPRGRWKPAP